MSKILRTQTSLGSLDFVVCHGRVGRAIFQSVSLQRTADTAVAHRIEDFNEVVSKAFEMCLVQVTATMMEPVFCFFEVEGKRRTWNVVELHRVSFGNTPEGLDAVAVCTFQF